MGKCPWHLCGKEFIEGKHSGVKQKFCSRKCMYKFAVNRRRKKLKILAVEYKGGKCSRCGYDKCIWALDFHHRDKTIKLFSMGGGGHTRSWERVKAELDKCDLVCSNCHREIESKEGPIDYEKQYLT